MTPAKLHAICSRSPVPAKYSVAFQANLYRVICVDPYSNWARERLIEDKWDAFRLSSKHGARYIPDNNFPFCLQCTIESEMLATVHIMDLRDSACVGCIAVIEPIAAKKGA